MKLKEMRIKMVGMQYRNPSKIPEYNDTVKLVPEPDNPVDDKAIAIMNQLDEKIGYVASANTVSRGNRKNGCIDNCQLLNQINFDNDDYFAFISKVRDNIGFINVVVED